VLDARTCEECRPLDGKVQASPYAPLPPFHPEEGPEGPWGARDACRCVLMRDLLNDQMRKEILDELHGETAE
jgi:hypothetical protein